jgi:hypothetical protein
VHTPWDQALAAHGQKHRRTQPITRRVTAPYCIKKRAARRSNNRNAGDQRAAVAVSRMTPPPAPVSQRADMNSCHGKRNSSSPTYARRGPGTRRPWTPRTVPAAAHPTGSIVEKRAGWPLALTGPARGRPHCDQHNAGQVRCDPRDGCHSCRWDTHHRQMLGRHVPCMVRGETGASCALAWAFARSALMYSRASRVWLCTYSIPAGLPFSIAGWQNSQFRYPS